MANRKTLPIFVCYGGAMHAGLAQFTRSRRLAVGAVGLVMMACSTHAPRGSTTASPGTISSEVTSGTVSAQAIPSDISFQSLEGPYWDAQSGTLFFSDVVEENGAAAKIYRYRPGPRGEVGQFSEFTYPIAPTSTNGLAVDGKGRVVACERWNGVLARVADGVRTVLMDRAPGAEGLSLNAPNDLVLRSDGNIYFSDTTWGARPSRHAPTAVYRVAPDGTTSEVLRLEMPNGVALSPDGATLYVGSDVQNRVVRLPVAPDGSVGAATAFVDARSVLDGKLAVPDGICVDDLGRVYVANNSAEVSAIRVFDANGVYLKRIALPVPPSNCSFGGADRRTLYITTLHALYQVQLDTPGLP